LILYICVAMISIILAYECGRVGRYANSNRTQMYTRACLVAIFVLLFAISAMRQNVGNDYAKYVEFMHRLYTDKYIEDAGVPTEWGFNLLARVIYGLSGYENYLLVFAIYAFATVGIFLSAMWKQSEDFALTFTMFMTLGYYFQSFSTVRYYLALAIALYCMRLAVRGEWISFIILVALGTGFHKSILVILPLYFLASRTWKKWQLAILFAISASCLFLSDLYLKVLIKLYPSYEDTEYLAGSGISYINIARCLAVLVLAIICYKETIQGDKKMQFYFYLNLGALALYVFCFKLPLVSRIGYYLTVSHILFVPAILTRMRDEKLKKIFKVLLLACLVLYFAMYLHKASDDGVLVLPYKTFWFNDMVDILSDVDSWT